MPATVDGQKGYDYQYVVTTFYTLHLIDRTSSGWIEARGHEDAYFELSANSSLIPVEVQIKKRKKRLALSDIAEMLCHFKEQSTTNCLITRMMDDPQLQAYFITNTSITEEVGKLSILSHKDSFEHIQFKPTQIVLNQLASELSKIKDKSKTLAAARGSFCQQLSASLSRDINQLRNVMARCFLIEGMTEPDLLHRIDLLLANQHKVSSSSRPVISDRLIKLINQSKGEKDSFLPAFKTILRRPQIHLPSLSPSYVPRPDETELKSLLLKDGYLLLTGPSFCGKSDTARSISWSLLLSSEMTSGYSNSIDAAEAFLLSAGNEEKLYLLDDPFGHLPGMPITNQLIKLHNLIKNLPEHTRRYLIVTSNERVLHTAISEPRLPWRNLVVSNRSFLEQIWIKLTDNSKTESALLDTVRELLKHEPVATLLQPGHLNHLINSAPHVKISDPTAIRDYAYIDAERIMLEIPPKFKKDFAILSCLASTISSCPVIEIAFVSDDNAKEQPGLLPKHRVRSLEIKKRKTTASFPSFEGTYDLLPAQLNALDYFEDRGYITREDGQYRFRHPVYLQAARLCLAPSPELSHQDIKQLLIRSLSTVNYDVATNAINTIGWVIQLAAIAQQNSYLRHLLEVTEIGLRSIFPSIQDQSFYILLQYYDQLNDELQEIIRGRIEYPRQDIGNIQWHNGIPYLSKIEKIVVSSMDNWKPVSATIANRTARKLGNGTPVSPQLTWQYLEYLRAKTGSTKSRVIADIAPLQKALLFNESFIKESAAYLLAASITDDEISLLEKLFREDDPQVLFNVIKGAWRAYPYFTLETNKTQVRQWIVNAFSQKWIPLRSIDLITQFDIGYSSHSFDWMYEIEEVKQADMWYIWGQVTPIMLTHLPIRVTYHAPRFIETLKTATAKLPLSINLQIVKSWIGWIRKFPDQYENRKEYFENLLYYFCLFMLQLSPNDRLPVINDLTSITIPVFRGIAFRNFQLFWERLTPEEQNLLVRKLNVENYSVKVIALTGFTNAVIQTAVCGQSLDKRNMPELLSILGKKQLLHCLTGIYLENNIYYLDYTDYQFWNDILHYFLKQTNSPANLLAIYQLVKKYILGDSGREQLEWPDIKNTIVEIYTNNTVEAKNWMAATIIYFSEWISYECGSKLSSLFIDLTEADKNIFVARIIDYIHILSDQRKITNISKELNSAITKYLQEDAHVLSILPQKKPDIIQTADTCLTYFERGTIRTKIAFEYYEDWLEEHRDKIPSTYNERFQRTKSTFDKVANLKGHQLFEEVHRPFNKFLLPLV